MRVFGIDCGTNCTGYGVVDVQPGRLETRLIAVAAGGLKLAKDQPLPLRLGYIFAELPRCWNCIVPTWWRSKRCSTP